MPDPLYDAIFRGIEGHLDGVLFERCAVELLRDVHYPTLRQLVGVAGRKPLRVTTDQHPSYRKAIRWILGRKVTHRTNQYLNNRTEQDHRGIKQRYYPMLGFANFASASRFCAAFDALRAYLRARKSCGEYVPLAAQRGLFIDRWDALITELAVA